MPVRTQTAPAKEEVKSKKAPAAKTPAPAPVKQIKKGKGKEPEAEVEDSGDGVLGPIVIKKSALQEEAKKFVESAYPGGSAFISTFIERSVTPPEGGSRFPAIFLTFSDAGAEDEGKENDETNVAVMKELIWYYHTADVDVSKNKPFVVEVLLPDAEGEPHIMCYYHA